MQDGGRDGCNLEKKHEKSQYLRNGLTDFDESWHGADSLCPFRFFTLTDRSALHT